MRLFSTLIALCTLFHIIPAFCQESGIGRIDCRRNEKWWGLSADMMPEGYFREPFETALADRPEAGPAIPAVFSDHGRYILAGPEARIMFDGTSFEILTPGPAPSAVKGGRTLREAYLVCVNRHGLKPAREIPTELSVLPVYDLRGAAVYGQEAVCGFAEMLHRTGFPPGIILIPDGWQSVNTLFSFDAELYPAPAEMTSRLHELGYRVMLTVTPYTAAAGRAYLQGESSGMFLTGNDGRPLTFRTPRGYACCLDMTLPGNVSLLERSADSLVRTGAADGFCFDCHEALPLLKDAPDKYSSFAEAWDNTGRNIPLSLHNPAGSGAGLRTAGALTRENIRKAVSEIPAAAMAGARFTGLAFDSGAEDETDLLLEAARIEALMPVAVLPTVPVGNEQYYLRLKEIVSRRTEIAGYMERLASETALTGEPMTRYMEYQYPNSGFANCTDQYAIGPGYVAAPAAEGESVRMIRLPKGIWYGPDGRRYRGPRVVEADMEAGPLPIFVSESRK